MLKLICLIFSSLRFTDCVSTFLTLIHHFCLVNLFYSFPPGFVSSSYQPVDCFLSLFIASLFFPCLVSPDFISSLPLTDLAAGLLTDFLAHLLVFILSLYLLVSKHTLLCLCLLFVPAGGLQAVAELLQVDCEMFGLSSDHYSVTLRRYAGMALTNLTFGDVANKVYSCAHVLTTCLRIIHVFNV